MMLRDKVVAVAGVGPGLGRAIALASAREGADVVLAARTVSRLDDVAKEVTALGRRAVAVPTDLADADAAAHLAETAGEAFGRIDALVYNALAMPPIKDLVSVDLGAIGAGFDANVVAALRLTRDLTPADGPQVAVVPFTGLPGLLPYYEDARVSAPEWRARIAARQAAVAERMLG